MGTIRFYAGDRVRLSAKARCEQIARADLFAREGVVISRPYARDGRLVPVLWDGLRQSERYHPMFLTHAPRRGCWLWYSPAWPPMLAP